MKTSTIRSILVLVAVTCSARGEPYEVAYYAPECEGCAATEGLLGPFPEDQGWTRVPNGVTRSIQSGELVLESQQNQTWEFYRKDMNDTLNPGPGEFLYLEWSMIVDFASTGYDNSIGVALDEFGGVLTIDMSTDHVRDAEGFERFDFEGGVFHTYLLVSSDLVNYQLFVDGQFAFTDEFKVPTGLNSFVAWGDTTTSFSTSRWRVARFGVAVPGDVDLNGSVNLLDFAKFAQCFSGSVNDPPAGCSDQEAALSDLDGNGVVNLSDFASFAQNFTG